MKNKKNKNNTKVYNMTLRRIYCYTNIRYEK